MDPCTPSAPRAALQLLLHDMAWHELGRRHRGAAPTHAQENQSVPPKSCPPDGAGWLAMYVVQRLPDSLPRYCVLSGNQRAKRFLWSASGGGEGGAAAGEPLVRLVPVRDRDVCVCNCRIYVFLCPSWRLGMEAEAVFEYNTVADIAAMHDIPD